MKQIPFMRPDIRQAEIDEVVDTLRSGWLTTGPKTARFEEEFAAYVGVPFALGTSSCTGALHLALAAMGIGRGDEVVTTTLTFAATANVVVHCGARPVFADIDPATLNVQLTDLERKLTEKTRAVIAVHYAGRPCDMRAVRSLCEPRGIRVLEDAAHAVGARHQDKAVGAWGDAAAFSFYANKNLTTGEGGMLTTSSEEIAARTRVLRLQGMTRDVFRRTEGGRHASWRYEIVAAGFKYPMGDIQAALGIHQLRRLPDAQAARARLAERYSDALAGVPGLSVPAPTPANSVHAWHLYVVRIGPEARLSRDQVFAGLGERGIETSVHFTPLHLQPYFRDALGYRPGDFPVAERAGEEILSLPLFPGLSDQDQDRVIGSLHELLGAPR